MFTVNKLSNGIPVVTAQTEGTQAVTVLIFAGAGSRYEVQKDRGISHFLEHMFFKGGDRFKTAAAVSMAIDSVGGDFNAFTGKEYAGYYVKVAAKQVGLACDVLSDMLINAKFPQHEIEKERGVIWEEYRMYQDTPMYQAGWNFESLMFGDQPLGWDTIGTEEVIRSVNTADFQKHKDELYTTDNLVITFAGNIDEKTAMKLAEEFFGSIGGKKSKNFAPLTPERGGNVMLTTKNTEQAHLVLGVEGVSALDSNHFAQKLLAIILGGTMSSRMFLNIREARGLCYYISTSTDSYLDAGILSTRAGVDQKRLHEAIEAILLEYKTVREAGITKEELQRSKDYLKGKITLSMEDSEELANFLGKQQLMYPKVRTMEEYFKEIDAVTMDMVAGLTQKILTPENMKLVVIGKPDSEAELKKLIES